MNGVHDLGGMHGFGTVVAEANEPVFHHDWERRTFALALATMGARLANVDEFRRTIERMPPGHYLESSYYEHWLFAVEGLLIEKGVITAAELAGANDDRPRAATSVAGAAGDTDSDEGLAWANPEASAATSSSSVKLRHNPKFKPRFRAGDRVFARNFNPTGHTRTPRYVRGHRGVIRRDWGTFVFPDAHAHGVRAKPQHCYSVEFKARELWGKDFPVREVINVDLWEGYLEPEQATSSDKPRAGARRRAIVRHTSSKSSIRSRRTAIKATARGSGKAARKKR